MPRSLYEANSGEVHIITLSADRLAQAGTPPAGTATSNIRAKVSKSNREYGIRPRGVTLARVIGTAPDQFTKYSFLPVLTAADASAAGFQLGGTITIGTIAWEIVGIVGEDF